MPIKSPAITPGIEPLPEASFYIPATEPTTRLRRTMKRDDCFLVFDSHGDIGASPGGPDGLFNCDTRYLSHFELLINGLQPLLLGSNLSDDNCVLSVDLTNPDIYYDTRILLQKNLLHVARTVFVWRSTLFHRFAVRNDGRMPVSTKYAWSILCWAFSGPFEVRGSRTQGAAVTSQDHQPIALLFHGRLPVGRDAGVESDLAHEQSPGQINPLDSLSLPARAQRPSA
jgi:hypothetical protein